MIPAHDIISENSQSTVVAQYERATTRSEAYQSEAELESSMIAQLQRQGYEYIQIHHEDELVLNLRHQLERLNGIRFTDDEWQRFFKSEIANESRGITDKAETIQRDNIKAFTLDDGTQRNICLIDKKNPHHNSTQVINQYEVSDGRRVNRYDVTILVNGLPLVHIELKRRGVSLREAFNQINRYGRESFWAGCSLYEYVQIFIISNGTETKYYSGTTRGSCVDTRQRIHNSFEFTSYWADAKNMPIRDLEDFTATFLTRHSLLNILTRYCVLTEQKALLVMRPYQIVATEKLINRIEIAHNARTYDTRDAGGYVWHTTGSGKTLTSFKAAHLASGLPYIGKVLFVVDRKDLDYQTMKEYDRFQRGAANGNTSTRELERQLNNNNSRIIITTIQKLANFIRKNPEHDVYNKETVIIFDECHRSQFGDMHAAITRRFRKYYLFGFTGTPIFSENATNGMMTTENVFGKKLHTYTIIDAIRDGSVLKFRVDYVSTIKEKEDIENYMVWNIDRESALMDNQRITNITQYILDHFDRQTKRSNRYMLNKLINISDIARGDTASETHLNTSIDGFNSIFAVQNIEFAKRYYNKFKELQKNIPDSQKLKVAIIFSYAANEDMEENNDDASRLDVSSRDFLDSAISDYNSMFNTNYDTSADKFPNYYKDLSLRMKNREIDILIVVNMFLTGFDSPTLNTLWVDKNLSYHGLLQAYSRTNRILNSVKTCGNIICFRNLEEATNKSFMLFGDAQAKSISVMRPFADYLNGYEKDGAHISGYNDYLTELRSLVKPGDIPLMDNDKKKFITLFGNILKSRNILTCFDKFEELDALSKRDMQDYTSVYLSLRDWYKQQSGNKDKEDIINDIEFKMELVKQVDINIDYIIFLIQKMKSDHVDNKEIIANVNQAMNASPSLRDKKDLVDKFVEMPGISWGDYINDEKRKAFAEIIREEHLRTDEAQEFIRTSWRNGFIPEVGMELNSIIPPINPFDPSANRSQKLSIVLDKIKTFFNKFFEITNNKF